MMTSKAQVTLMKLKMEALKLQSENKNMLEKEKTRVVLDHEKKVSELKLDEKERLADIDG